MAIYHLHAKIIQRSKGKSAIAAAAYRHACKSFDEGLGLSYDYSKKQNVIHCEISVPNHACEFLQGFKSQYSLIETSNGLNVVDAKNKIIDCHEASSQLWNFIETQEKRVDAQLAREMEFSLPLELTQQENILLARTFIQEQLVARGMIADWSVHWDIGNPHVHVMLSMRELTQNGFGKKCVAWHHKDFLNQIREKWAEYANFHLRMLGHDIRIDHRSYEAQGIDLIPGIHLGKAVTDMQMRGICSERMESF